VEHRVAVRPQYRLDPFDVRLGAAHQERHVAGGDVVRAAAHRGVEHADAVRRGLGGDGAGGTRAAGGVQDEGRSLGHRLEQAAVQADLPDLFVAEDAHADNRRAAARLGDLRHRVRAHVLQGLARRLRPAEHADLVAGRHETVHHRTAHPSGPDEPDAHRGLPMAFRHGDRQNLRSRNGNLNENCHLVLCLFNSHMRE